MSNTTKEVLAAQTLKLEIQAAETADRYERYKSRFDTSLHELNSIVSKIKAKSVEEFVIDPYPYSEHLRNSVDGAKHYLELILASVNNK